MAGLEEGGDSRVRLYLVSLGKDKGKGKEEAVMWLGPIFVVYCRGWNDHNVMLPSIPLLTLLQASPDIRSFVCRVDEQLLVN